MPDPTHPETAHPPRNRLNTIIPLIPIAMAILVAFIAARYGKSPTTTVEHDTGVDVGNTAPNFILPDERGVPVNLSSITPQKNVLLVFYLGYDCPRCVRNLRDIADHIDQFNNANIQVLAISPDTPAQSQKAIKQFGTFPFPLLSDPDKKTAAAYSLTLPENRLLHGIFLIDHQNKIHFATRSDRPYDNLLHILQRLPPLKSQISNFQSSSLPNPQN